MLRHIQKHHGDQDLQLLPCPRDDECEPQNLKVRHEVGPRSRTKSPRTRAKRSRKSYSEYNYMTQMRDDSDDEDDGADVDANDKAIKLLTGLLVKQDAAMSKGSKPVEDLTTGEIERELKEIELKKARAELKEVEVRIEERKERIALYNEVRTNLSSIAEAAKFVLNNGTYQNRLGDKNVLEEAYSQLVHDHDGKSQL